MRMQRSALFCLVMAVGALLSSGCHCCRPFLFRPWCNQGCWPGYQQAGAGSMSYDPGCAACFSPPAGTPIFTGAPHPLTGPNVQQIPPGTPMPTTGGAKTGN